MNINYEDIITRANARAESLKEIQQAMARVPDAIEMLDEALSYFENLGQLVGKLDAEGKLLLGDAHSPAYHAAHRATSARISLFGGDRGLTTLAVEAAK